MLDEVHFPVINFLPAIEDFRHFGPDYVAVMIASQSGRER